MNIAEHTLKLREARMNLFSQMEEINKDAEGRLLTAEERQKWDRIDAAIVEHDEQIRGFVQRETREQESAKAREGLESVFGEHAVTRQAKSEADEMRAFLRGESRGNGRDWEGKYAFGVDINRGHRETMLQRQGASETEIRTLLWDTGSSGSLVPTTLNRDLYQYLEASVAMLKMPTTKLFTDSGENIDFPRVNAHGIATQVIAQGTAIGGTDATFAKMTLNSFKFGQLVQLGSEVVQDSGIDIVGFVTRNVARAVGRLIDVGYVAGAGGANAINGVTTAAIVGSGGTISTGGSLINPSYENLVDLVYGVNDEYRNGGNAAWLINDLTAAYVRKIRSDGGGTIGPAMWVPSVMQGIQGGQPDHLLGFPVYTDPNVASLASNAKVAVFGDFSAYYIRTVGQFVFERSDEFAFNTDLVTFRGKLRTDGDVIDLTALNLLKRSV